MSGRTFVNLFQLALLLMLLLAVALVSAVVTMSFAIHGAEVQVPALKGMTVAQALSETAGLGLNLDVDNRYYSGEVAAGHILSQSPEAGTVVRREWLVRVSESLGPQQVDVPDTVGLAEREAELMLRRAGLEVAQPIKLPTTAAAEDTVLAQDPPAHTKDIAQPSVSLLVATPSEEHPDGYVMPDLAAMQGSAALAALGKAGIRAAQPTLVNISIPKVGEGAALPKAPVAPGSVMAQTPAAGTRIDQSTVVKISIAR